MFKSNMINKLWLLLLAFSLTLNSVSAIAQAPVVPPHSGGSVRGVVFNDIDGNGAKDIDDSGVAGWEVVLDENQNGERDDGEKSMTTGETGQYAFASLDNGEYWVTLVSQAGWNQTLPSSGPIVIDITAGQSFSDQDFGVYEDVPAEPVGIISGVVFQDENVNSIQDGSELGINGVEVYLDSNDNETLDADEDFTITVEDGSYSFTELVDGDYTVRLVEGADWLYTLPESGFYDVNISSGADIGDRDFGIVYGSEISQLGTIDGALFNDLNGNGVWDEGENPLINRTVYIDSNDNSILDADEIQTLTNELGEYLFEDVSWESSIVVRQVLPIFWEQSYPAVAHEITLNIMNPNSTGNDFGSYEVSPECTDETPCTVSGYIWQDDNRDGIFDDGEKPLQGKVVFLDKNENGLQDDNEQVATTNEDGFYSFNSVVAGAYHLIQSNMDSSWFQTYPDEGMSYMHSIAVVSDNVEDKNFGLAKYSHWLENGIVTLMGLIFNDGDGNGINDGESGLESELVFVDLNDNGLLDAYAEPWTETDSDGAWAISGLISGTNYLVKNILKDGWIRTFPSGPEYYDVDTEEESELSDIDFGIHYQTPTATGGSSSGSVADGSSDDGDNDNNGTEPNDEDEVQLPVQPVDTGDVLGDQIINDNPNSGDDSSGNEGETEIIGGLNDDKEEGSDEDNQGEDDTEKEQAVAGDQIVNSSAFEVWAWILGILAVLFLLGLGYFLFFLPQKK